MSHETLKGKQAPSFTLKDHNGASYTLPPEGGLPSVLFFYPKSGSYGCTKEACQFRDAMSTENPALDPSKVRVVGISPDPVAKQKAFVDKHNLNYPVLSDEKGEAFKAYGIGKGIFGLTDVARVTFIIDEKGIIQDTLDATMNYGAHIKFVEKWIKRASASTPASATTTTPA